ncbi:hypothetical protein Tco_0729072 [Tanacetum coccineum]|uniref:Uncharacterized protein n=1 Tax=Tanacetum coccineum TaxID=301880 RepID=A0ABQ4YP01_9ASTR
MDKCKTGLGYNVVPLPYTKNFMPPKSDLVYPSLDDFVDVNESISESVVEKPSVETNEPKSARKENGALIIEEWPSDSDEENVPKVKTVKPNFTKIEFVKPKTDRKSVEQIRQDTYNQSFSPSRSPRGNKRNWNQQMPADPLFSQNSKDSFDDGFKPSKEEEKKDVEDPGNESGNPTEGKDSEVPSTEEPRINHRDG